MYLQIQNNNNRGYATTAKTDQQSKIYLAYHILHKLMVNGNMSMKQIFKTVQFCFLYNNYRLFLPKYISLYIQASHLVTQFMAFPNYRLLWMEKSVTRKDHKRRQKQESIFGQNFLTACSNLDRYLQILWHTQHDL